MAGAEDFVCRDSLISCICTIHPSKDHRTEKKNTGWVKVGTIRALVNRLYSIRSFHSRECEKSLFPYSLFPYLEPQSTGETVRVKDPGEILPNGRLHTTSKYLQNGEWVKGHEVSYHEDPAASVNFK